MKLIAMTTALVVASAGFAWAQHAPSSHSAPGPYAGFQERPIKALSAQQIADLRAGRGMGLALAAELNGFPGPLHVLEFAAGLELTDAQRTKVGRLFADMKGEAVPVGERLIDQEADLDRQFADRTVTLDSLAAGTQAIGLTQGALRNVHLKYHLATLAVLTSEQVARYATLRGYAALGPHRGHH
jgi:Spy/CpxP family protein refolding chaperone